MTESDPTSDRSTLATELDPRLLESLICPLTHGPLRYNRETDELISPKALLAFPVRGSIPIMLESEARKLDENGQ